MLKRDFIIAALKAGLYTDLYWLISIFTMTREQDAVAKERYPYKVVSDQTGYYFVDPLNKGELTKLDDGHAGQALFSIYTPIDIGPGDMVNVKSAITTRVGRMVQNYILLVYPFADRIPYINKVFTPNTVQDIIAPVLVKDGDPKEGGIPVSLYLKLADAADFLTGLSQVCTVGVTRRTILPAPGLREYRDKLYEENADKLDKLETVAAIQDKMVQYEKDTFKDDQGMRYLNSDKAWRIVRKKLFGTVGAEQSLKDGNSFTLIKNSLDEDLDPDSLAPMLDTMRSGSYDRGAETELGGLSVKKFQRSSSNVRVTENDCGSKMGKPMLVTEKNKKKLIQRYILTATDPILVESDEDASVYVGKRIRMRSPQYCKLGETDYCKTCTGARLGKNPNTAPIAISDYGSRFLYMFMLAMHGKVLAVQKFRYKELIV